MQYQVIRRLKWRLTAVAARLTFTAYVAVCSDISAPPLVPAVGAVYYYDFDYTSKVRQWRWRTPESLIITLTSEVTGRGAHQYLSSLL
jgi:hypothetical protein